MKRLSLLILVVFYTGCYSQAQVKAEDDKWAKEHGYIPASSAETPTNPCSDKRFRELKQKPIDSLTIREYDFIRTMEDRCEKYKTHALDAEKESQSTSPFVIAILATLGVVV